MGINTYSGMRQKMKEQKAQPFRSVQPQNVVKPKTIEVGKTYKIAHRRKGKWTAKVLSNDGEWLTLDDDPSSPVRIEFLTATEVK